MKLTLSVKIVDSETYLIEIGEYLESKIDYFNENKKKELIDQLSLDKNNLEEALNKCAGRIYYYGSEENTTTAYIEGIEGLMNKREAIFMKEYRLKNDKMAYKEKEADIRRLLTEDEDWYLLYRCLSSLKIIKNEYSSILRAFEVQGRLLLSANKRDMFKTEVSA